VETPFIDSGKHLICERDGQKKSAGRPEIANRMSEGIDKSGSETGSSILLAEAGRKVVLEARGSARITAPANAA
jgi:hypothetical protein